MGGLTQFSPRPAFCLVGTTVAGHAPVRRFSLLRANKLPRRSGFSHANETAPPLARGVGKLVLSTTLPRARFQRSMRGARTLRIHVAGVKYADHHAFGHPMGRRLRSRPELAPARAGATHPTDSCA